MDSSHAPLEPTGKEKTANDGRVQVIDRAVLLLRTLSSLKQGGSALELARLTGIDRTTIHRLLKTLAHWKLIEPQAGNYRIGPESLIYSTAYLNRLNLRRIALPYAIELQRVIDRHQAIVSISMPVGDEVVLIERMWTPSTPLNVIVDLADQFPIERVPSGQAILATYSDPAVLELLGRTRHDEALPILQRIRGQSGFSFGDSVFKAGLTSVAYPVLGKHGQAVGALVVAGLEMADEMTPDSTLASHVRRACEGVSAQLTA
ncbi:DNA-binding transcriptional regulator, IclR family [Pseudomonas flavescens]|uniref:HTH-type transcriptional repressor AllR n=1 Tax=Phytopseudomonas flavescens TaxID=29435 RepID=A0A1G8ADR2_9GAMM|nr:helix-turn-helix domain-containing protein [Pseudomonas flavescens]SDH18480.1 DNA-binding transcriptional regulator, IclR family [Pseudomonas flavescens]